MTLEALGKAASLGYKHIAEIERGQKVPSFEAIDRLASALDVSPYELFLPESSQSSAAIRSLRNIMREIDEESSPAVKRFVLQVLSLVRQVEKDLPEKSQAKFLELLQG